MNGKPQINNMKELKYTQEEFDKKVQELLTFYASRLELHKKCPIFILKSGANEIFASFDHEPSDEEIDIEYAKYLKQDSVTKGTASWNCVLYRIVVGEKIESWNGPCTGSKYNWITANQ